MRRGDGIGLEVGPTVVRAVRLSADGADPVAAVSEVVIARPDDNSTIVDALVRARGQLGLVDAPTRLAWFPQGATLQRLDATGRSGTELNEMRHDLAERHDIGSTMLIDAAARRWMITLGWDHAGAWRLQELVERAGFVDVEVEPAPVAAQRVLPREAGVVRRDAEPALSWAGSYDEAGPVAVITVPIGSREHPGLAMAPAAVGLHHLDDVLADPELAAALGRIVGTTLDQRSGPSEPNVSLRIADTPYPPFPPHDLRAARRIVVALGAAVGAAGLAGRLRSVDVLAPTAQIPDMMPRPWAIEQVSTEAPVAERSTPTPMQQLRVRLGAFIKR
ncbi:MAG: hypothetical protein QNM02_13560 [Acidimicrobiia bacterium]|nr:hypothetical protein [Acidimicrobiia bacterium]